MEYLFNSEDTNKQNSENSGSIIKQRVSREQRMPLGEITHLWTEKQDKFLQKKKPKSKKVNFEARNSGEIMRLR